MSGTVTKSTIVQSTPEKVRQVILDVEAYPGWQREMESVAILTKDQHGRPESVKFDVSAMGQKAGYTLTFSYPDENTIESHLTDGDLITKQDQRYRLTAIPGGGTEIDYSLDITIKWQVPDFMINAIINKGIKTNLGGIKAQAER
jgi:ribosome-associated toxin RatA of RatAB toxin-antitoxin module